MNPQQLVLRLDSATGFAKVGWAADLPVGRFIPIEVIGETALCEAYAHGILPHDNPLFEKFLRACQRARDINRPLLAEQRLGFIAKGFMPVPLDLNDSRGGGAEPDLYGCYHEAAMRALFRLTANFARAWAVVDTQVITHLCSCKPPKPMEELEFQVWKQHILNKLSRIQGEIINGTLIVQESGLWLCPLPEFDEVPNYLPR